MELAAFLSMNIPDIEDPNIPSLLPGGGEVLSATDPEMMSIPIWCCIMDPWTSGWGSLFSMAWVKPCPWCSMVEADECPPCWSGGHWEPNNSGNWLLFIFWKIFKSFFYFLKFKYLSDFRPMVLQFSESNSHRLSLRNIGVRLCR